MTIRGGRGVVLGVLGGFVLFLYGVLPTLQPRDVDFGRVYAAYGGIFVVLSLLWGWKIDGHKPERVEVIDLPQLARDRERIASVARTKFLRVADADDFVGIGRPGEFAVQGQAQSARAQKIGDKSECFTVPSI